MSTKAKDDLAEAIVLLYEAKRTLAAQDENTAYAGSRQDFPVAPTVDRIRAFLTEAVPRQRARWHRDNKR